MALAPVSEQLTEIRGLREARTAIDVTRLLESKKKKTKESTNPRTLKREGQEWGAKFAPSKGWGTPMKMSKEGGPGSGPQSGHKLSKRGFSNRSINPGKSTFGHKDGSKLSIYHDGSWTHSSRSGKMIGEGNSSSSLSKHLSKHSY